MDDKCQNNLKKVFMLQGQVTDVVEDIETLSRRIEELSRSRPEDIQDLRERMIGLAITAFPYEDNVTALLNTANRYTNFVAYGSFDKEDND